MAFKLDTFANKGNTTDLMTELQSCMSKFMQTHNWTADTQNKSCGSLKHGKP